MKVSVIWAEKWRMTKRGNRHKSREEDGKAAGVGTTMNKHREAREGIEYGRITGCKTGQEIK